MEQQSYHNTVLSHSAGTWTRRILFSFFVVFTFTLVLRGQGLAFNPATGTMLSDDHQTLTLTFNQPPVGNVPDVKACVRCAVDGVHYDALAPWDTVRISGSTLQVRFQTALCEPSMRLKIMPNALRTGSGAVKADETVTGVIDASGAIFPTATLKDLSTPCYIVPLNGQAVENLACADRDITIKTGMTTYRLPASQIDIDGVYTQMDYAVAYKDILATVTIILPPDNSVKIVEDPANKNNYNVVVKPIVVDIPCTGGGRTVDVSKFSGYIEQIVAIPDGIDPSKITAGIVLNEDGTFSHVPASIIIIDGKYYAKLNALTHRMSAPDHRSPGGVVVMGLADGCNTPPAVTINTGLSLVQGATSILSNTSLAAADDQQPAGSITYQIESAPKHGRLERSTSPGVALTAFTQAELAAGVICYVSDGSSGAASDVFSFSVSDGIGGVTNVNTFAMTIAPIILPVTLESFSAAQSKGGIDLRWRTVSEMNTYGFDVERKAGVEWVRIGFVAARGTSSAPSDYCYTDRAAEAGHTGYRLKQIDRDGAFSYSSETEVDVHAAPAQYMLAQNFPNPFNPSTRISYSIPVDAHVKLSVYDMLGREVVCLVEGDQLAGSHTCTFESVSCPAGVYFYTLQAGGFSSAKKLVIIK